MVVKKKKKITAEIVATTSLPVDRLTATDCNAAARANNHTKCVVNFPLVLPNWVGILSWLP